jgi:hypothetical protein
MQHYVKKLGEKNYWHELRSVRVFVLCVGQALCCHQAKCLMSVGTKTMTVIFLGALGRSGNLLHNHKASTNAEKIYINYNILIVYKTYNYLIV